MASPSIAEAPRQWQAWDWLEWDSVAGVWHRRQGVGKETTKQKLGQLLEASSSVACKNVSICFMPQVEELYTTDKAFCNYLSENMHIPRFFWSAEGWNSNGFFWAQHQFGKSVVASVARLLLKDVQQSDDGVPDYKWRFLSMASYWRPNEKNPEQVGTVFIVFDSAVENDGISPAMMERIASSLETRKDVRVYQHNPLGTHVLLLEPLLQFFYSALWHFQSPVRDCEKYRTAITTASKDRHTEMAELSRHIIHASETLEAARRVLESMIEFARTHRKDLLRTISDAISLSDAENFTVGGASMDASPTTLDIPRNRGGSIGRHSRSPSRPNEQMPSSPMIAEQTAESLSFYSQYFTNLLKRSAAFEKRLHNEINLAHHIISAQEAKIQEHILRSLARDAVTQREILKKLKDDGKGLARLVSYLTISFLPASFITGFFSMTVFNFTPDKTTTDWYFEHNGWLISYYIFVAVAVIIVSTAICWAAVMRAGLLGFLKPKPVKQNSKTLAINDTAADLQVAGTGAATQQTDVAINANHPDTMLQDGDMSDSVEQLNLEEGGIPLRAHVHNR